MRVAISNKEPHCTWADPGFFRGGLKDEFTRMCTDCIAVKTQMLR